MCSLGSVQPFFAAVSGGELDADPARSAIVGTTTKRQLVIARAVAVRSPVSRDARSPRTDPGIDFADDLPVDLDPQESVEDEDQVRAGVSLT